MKSKIESELGRSRLNPFTVVLATRGSALALSQTRMLLAQCQNTFPRLDFQIKVFKTTGDKLRTSAVAQKGMPLPKGLFTKELEIALAESRADMAVHSLKDLPTELPSGLKVGAVTKRADPRDVLIFRRTGGAKGKNQVLGELRGGAVVGTSSTRRRAQLLTQRGDLRIMELRGNIVSRLRKLASQRIDALVLAAAGLERMKWAITAEGQLAGDGVPEGVWARVLGLEEMLPCAGQGALGIEIRNDDEGIAALCERLNDFETNVCVTAERAFLEAMEGGCSSPMAAYAKIVAGKLWLRAMSFSDGIVRRIECKAGLGEGITLGQQLAAELKIITNKGLVSTNKCEVTQPLARENKEQTNLSKKVL